VVVHDLNVVCVSISPREADSPSVVDPDAELPGAITTEPFQAITRRYAKIF
jgi:hypothetical protein